MGKVIPLILGRSIIMVFPRNSGIFLWWASFPIYLPCTHIIINLWFLCDKTNAQECPLCSLTNFTISVPNVTLKIPILSLNLNDSGNKCTFICILYANVHDAMGRKDMKTKRLACCCEHLRKNLHCSLKFHSNPVQLAYCSEYSQSHPTFCSTATFESFGRE